MNIILLKNRSFVCLLFAISISTLFPKVQMHAAQDNFVSYYNEVNVYSIWPLVYDFIIVNDSSGLDFTSSTDIYMNGTGYGRTDSISANPGGQDGVMIKNLDLTYANFYQANSIGANFTGKDLSYAKFNSADLRNANLSGTNLTQANLSNAYLENTNFENAIIYSANFTAPSSYYPPVGFVLTELQLKSTRSYKDKNLGAIIFSDNDLRGWDFSGQNMQGARFDGFNTYLQGTNFSGANLENASFAFATQGPYGESNIGPANFSKANLNHADFNSANMTGADFSNASLVETKFESTNLSGANFRGADLTHAVFNTTVALAGNQNTDLSGADFTDAIIFGAQLAYATRDNNFTYEQLISTKSYKDKNLGGINLSYCTLGGFEINFETSGISFSGFNLEGAYLFATKISLCNFTDANIKGAEFRLSNLSYSQLISTKSYKEKDLGAIGLDDGYTKGFFHVTYDGFEGWDLSGQNLEGAKITGQVWGYESYLDENGIPRISLANVETILILKDGELFSQHVLESFLENNKAWSLDLTDANIKGASFSGGIRNNVFDYTDNNYGNLTFAQIASTKSYKEKNLVGVTFGNISLEDWDFTGQNMQGFSASWPGDVFNMNGTNFTSADLRHHSIYQVFPGAIFKNTIGWGGNIINIDMTTSSDYIHVRRDELVPDNPRNVVIQADENITFSGDSHLILEEGGIFEIEAGGYLKLENTNIDFHIGNTDSGKIIVNGTLEFTEFTKINIFLSNDFLGSLNDFDLISLGSENFRTFVSEITSQIIGTISKDQISVMDSDGEAFKGSWDFSFSENGFYVSIPQVPEPAELGAVFASLALGFSVYFRRKKK